MLLLDKLYINIYYVVNKRLNRRSTTIWVLNYLLYPPPQRFYSICFQPGTLGCFT
jgi:hypothetical protein